MGIAVLTSYLVALAIGLFGGMIHTFAGFLVLSIVATVGVVVFAELGKVARG